MLLFGPNSIVIPYVHIGKEREMDGELLERLNTIIHEITDMT